MADGEWQVKFGQEKGDETFRPIPSLQWSLDPLPLPTSSSALERPTPCTSLTSLCLTVISRNLPLFTPESFQGVPPTLVRKVFIRARDDRAYDEVVEVKKNQIPCPDLTTLWALETMALLGNEALGGPGVVEAHTAVLPTEAMLYSLNIPTSPLRRLISILPLSHCTSLSLINARNHLNDETCISLRHLSSLVVLVISGTAITDVGIRKLSSSLDKDDDGMKRGMWGLKALYLRGCGGITDRGISSLARFGGLCFIDVAIALLNRQSRKLYPSRNLYNPTNQIERTMSLTMFSAYATNNARLSSALQICCADRANERVVLHLRGTQVEIPISQWPGSFRASANARAKHSKVYRDSGIGVLYGADVGNVPNPSTEVDKLMQNVNSKRSRWGAEVEEEHVLQNSDSRVQRIKRKKGGRARRSGHELEREAQAYEMVLRAALGSTPVHEPGARGPPLMSSEQAYRAYLYAQFASMRPAQDGSTPATIAPWASNLYSTPTERSKAFIAPPSTAPKLSSEERRAKLQESEEIIGESYLMLSRSVSDEWELPMSMTAKLSHAEALQRERETPVQVKKRSLVEKQRSLPKLSGASQVESLIGVLDAQHFIKRSRQPMDSSQGSSPSSSQEARPIQGVGFNRRDTPSPGITPAPIQGLGFRQRRAASPGITPRPLLPVGATPTPGPNILPPLPAPFKLVTAQNPFRPAAPRPANATGVIPLGFSSSGATKRKWVASATPENQRRGGMLMFGGKRA